MLSPLNREGFFNSISLTNHADIKFIIWIDNCYRLHYRYDAIKKRLTNQRLFRLSGMITCIQISPPRCCRTQGDVKKM
ncbi:hypothetical protein F2N28_10175 [Escherichia coli]|nr:hypothetical protein [Escherichia coli]EFE8011250.1 hypothetical protein [Escherichia coli]